MSTKRSLRRWAVALGAAAALATGDGAGAPSSAPTNAAAAATPGPGGATPAPACPSAEYPAAGALSIADGAVAWFVCSPDEVYRTVVGASDDVVLVEESGPTGRRTIAFDAA